MQTKFAIQILNPFRYVSKARAKNTDFSEKCIDALFIFLGRLQLTDIDKPLHTTQLGILDYFGFIFVRLLFYLGTFLNFKLQYALRDKQKTVIFLFPIILVVGFLVLLLAIPYLLLAGLLTAISLPFIWIADKIWPKSTIIDSAANIKSFTEKCLEVMTFDSEEDQNKNSVSKYFFLPFIWIIVAILLTIVSLLLQGLNLDLFAQAAAPLFITTTLLKITAGITLITAGLSYLMHHGFNYLYDSNTEPQDDASLEASQQAVETSFVEIISNTRYWIYGIGVLILLVILILTLGYFTNGFELSPESFQFMGDLFNFMSDGFLKSVHASAMLPGLTFLAQLSDANILLAGQIGSVALLMIAPIPFMGLALNLCPDKTDTLPIEPVLTPPETIKKNEPKEVFQDSFMNPPPEPVTTAIQKTQKEETFEKEKPISPPTFAERIYISSLSPGKLPIYNSSFKGSLVTVNATARKNAAKKNMTQATVEKFKIEGESEDGTQYYLVGNGKSIWRPIDKVTYLEGANPDEHIGPPIRPLNSEFEGNSLR